MAETPKIKQRVEAAARELADALASQDKIRANRTILCGCGSRHQIKALSLIITHWYVEPHGCTGGDYWLEGEWQFVCPVNDLRNRLLFFDDNKQPYEMRDNPATSAEHTFKCLYRSLFKDSQKEYRDDDRSPTCNNTYVDKHRMLFELPPVWEKQ